MRQAFPLTLGLIAFLLLETPHAAEYPGAILGGFNVSDQGAGQYTIPIVAPAATGGLKPRLALTYNHLSGNGLAGIRWTLTGFSSIIRCPKTVAQDGVTDDVSYDSDDQLCLDGMRLVDIGSNEYRTEIESFQRIKIVGTLGSGTEKFTVEHGNGQKSYYGYTADSLIQDVNDSSNVRIWYRAYTEDPHGNRISYGYNENTSTGEVYPDEVIWTSNSGQGLSARYRINIAYETRPSDDQRSGFDSGGAPWEKTKRIDYIQVLYDTSTEISKYDLAYSSGTGGRSQLDDVTLSRGSDSLPESVFTWQDGTSGWATAVDTNKAVGTNPLVGDFNNDGLQDIFVYLSGTWQVYRGRSDGGLETAINSGVSSYLYPELTRVIDYNGDGKSDLLYLAPSYYWKVLVSTGTGFTDTSSGLSFADFSTPLVIDYDGDGLQDIFYVDTSGYSNWIANTGGGFGSEVTIEWVGTEIYSLTNSPGPDTNGDGRPAIIWHGEFQQCNPSCANYNGTNITELNDPGYDYIWWTISPAYDPSGHMSPRSIDINGDGLSDVVFANPGDNDIHLMINDGTTFGTPVDTNIDATEWDNMVVADWDSDGRGDLLVPSGNTWYVHRSNGSTLPATATTSFSSNGADSGAFVADMTGDDLPDIVQKYGGDWHIVPHSGVLPDVVETFTDGLGAGVDVTYESLALTDHYTVDSGDAPSSASENQYGGTRYVVTDEDRDDGIGGTRNIDHLYDTAWIDRSGRGWLSFDNHTIKDMDGGTHTVTAFRQDFPYAGVVSGNELRRSSDSQLIKDSDLTWSKTTDT